MAVAYWTITSPARHTRGKLITLSQKTRSRSAVFGRLRLRFTLPVLTTWSSG